MAEEQVGTIARAIQLIRAIAEATEPQSVSGLATKLNLPNSTVHRLLQLLKDDDIVEADPATRRYSAGGGLYRIADSLADSRSIVTRARPFLLRVQRGCNETCVLSVPSSRIGMMQFADQVESSQALRISMPLNVELPVIWGASGLSLLSGYSLGEVESLLAKSEPSPIRGTPVPKPADFWRALQADRDRGYSITYAEKISGSVGIAAPVLNRHGRAIAAITATVPLSRFAPEQESLISALVMDAARDLSDYQRST